ncbi:MAG TPA: CARDB domain-containing protein, partial [Anaeromyxobacteraceae bacterium]|nr:CARDB domain-containing protein [Anaeromyxobacteraceae bacterium]
MVVRTDSPTFGSGEPSSETAVAQEFFRSHADAYDFVVVFPTFPVSVYRDSSTRQIGGWYAAVRNAVSGIGQPILDRGPEFGSRSRLQGYIEMHSLAPGYVNALVPGRESAALDDALVILAHETAHRWSGRAAYRDPSTGASSGALLCPDGDHWSYLLDSDASVLYGADWRDAGGGAFVADAVRRRYSALDLYLMGFLDPSEVPPFSLLWPGPGTTVPAECIDPAQGTRIAATATSVSVDDVIAAEGPRSPPAAASQSLFRAAFVVLLAPGQAPAAGQLEFVDTVRREWANRFFYLTRGRGVIETDLVEHPPVASAPSPSVRSAVDYLVAAQLPDGAWADTEDTRIRETQLAAQALASTAGLPGVDDAIARARGYLEQLSPAGADGASRRILGLVASVGQVPAGLPATEPGGGVGLSPGYPASVIDSALAALAAEAAGAEANADYVAAVLDFLVRAQNRDGGWPFMGGGPSRIESTAWVLRALARVGPGTAASAAAEAGLVHLQLARQPDGSYGEEGYGTAAATAEVVLALADWDRFHGADAEATWRALMAMQSPDGSFDGEVHATALAAAALARVALPNLSVSAAGIAVSRASVADGDAALVSIRLANLGMAPARNAVVRVVDSFGRPFAQDATVPFLDASGETTLSMTVDTAGHGGSAALFVVVDPDQRVDEVRRDDNRAGIPFAVVAPPPGPDPFVAGGTLQATPATLDRLPASATVSAMLGNAGQTSVAVDVVIQARGAVVSRTTVDLPARTRVPFAAPIDVPAGAGDVPYAIVVDPDQRVDDANRDNDSAEGVIRVVPSVDLAVASVAATPSSLEQGGTVRIAYAVTNGGTLDATASRVTVTVQDGTGGTAAVLGDGPFPVPAGQTVAREISWRAFATGSLRATVVAIAPQDTNPSNDSGSTSFTVTPSALPNLTIVAQSPAVAPDPALQGQTAAFTAKVVNAGRSASGPFAVEIWVGDPDKGGSLAGRQAIPGLDAGAQQQISASVPVDGANDLSLVVRVDSEDAVREYDETDNIAALTVHVRSLPDLVLNDAAIDLSRSVVRPGETVSVGVTVRNVGAQDAGATTVDLVAIGPGGDTASLGSRPIPALKPSDSARVEFTWAANVTGLTRLAAEVNASRAVKEGRYDNDRGERAVGVQVSDVVASNPYLSPNGDGVKDDTSIMFRAFAPGDAVVDVTDLAGQRVRQLRAAGAAGLVVWDGRDDAGLVVRDGHYRAVVRAQGAAAADVGALDLVVDTNRSPLQDVGGTDLLEQSAVLDFGDGGRHRLAPDGESLIAAGCRGNDCGWWRQPLDGGDPSLLAGFYPGYTVSAPTLSADGRWLAYGGLTSICLYREDWGWTDCTRLFLTDLNGTGGGGIVFSGNAEQVDWRTNKITEVYTPAVLSADGSRILVSTGSYLFDRYGRGRVSPWTYQLETISADGTSRHVVADAASCSPFCSDYSFSPDGAQIAFVGTKGLQVTPADGGDPIVIDPVPLYRQVVHGSDSITLQETYRWMPDGSGLAVSSPDGSIRIIDPATGAERMIQASSESELLVGFGVAESAGAIAMGVWDLTSPDLAMRTDVADPIDGPRKRLADEYLGTLEWAQSDTTLLVTPPAWTSEQTQIYRSLANLGARLGVTRAAGSPVAVFRGTAADANLESWEIRVRFPGETDDRVLARGVESVVRAEFLEWEPPREGVYEATLTVADKAGNTAERRARFAWTDSPAVANVVVQPAYISPNGDGVQDVAGITYSISAATTFDVVVTRADGTEVRRFQRTHLEPGDYSTAWDGRDDAGVVVRDGAYRVAVDRFVESVVVDTVPPKVQFAVGDALPPRGSQPFHYALEGGRPLNCTYSPAGPPNPQPVAQVNAELSLQATDENLYRWVLEKRAGDAFVEVTNGADETESNLELPLFTTGAARYRVRAADLAGNTTVSDELAPPERLFVVGMAMGAVGDGACNSPIPDGVQGALPYRVLPGRYGNIVVETALDPSAPDDSLVVTTPWSPAQVEQIVAGTNTLEILDSIDGQIVYWGVRYRPAQASSADWIEAGDVNVLRQYGVSWTPPAGVGPYEAKVAALDVQGRWFESQAVHVSVGAGGTGGGTRDQMQGCVRLDPTEELVLTV